MQALREFTALANRYAIWPMSFRTVEQIRHENLKALAATFRFKKDFAEAIGKSDSQLSQWINRSRDSKTGTEREISGESCREIEDKLGKPRGWMDQDHSGTGADIPSLAQQASQPPRMIEPITIRWESVMSSLLPALFKMQLPDDSMAPEYRAGTWVTFSTEEGPLRVDDAVLVADADGNVFFRIYSERRPGHWRAVPLASGYEPLDSISDGLRVLAIAVGKWGRRG